MPDHLQVRRLQNNIKHHSNWLSYFLHKFFGSKNGFTFKGKTGLNITVPQRMMHTYKECFFDESYFKGMPQRMEKQQLKTVIDIGANVGYFSLSVFSIDPEARVWAFEPMPVNFELLKKYRSNFPQLNFEIVNKAVSHDGAAITLNYSDDNSFTTAASIFDSGGKDQVEVETVTLEDFMADNSIQQLDLLKLDCEGAEYQILYGLPLQLFNSIERIAVETHLGSEDNQNLLSLKAFLESKGYATNALGSMIYAWK